MLKRISIQNFKGIGPRVDLDLRPVTLLFGPNSAGKSTILHAIHYAHAVLQSGDPDVGRTRLGGDIDLGGFRQLVHNHDLDATLVMAFEFAPDDEELRERMAWYLRVPEEEVFAFPADTVRVEFHARWSAVLQAAVVVRYEVAAPGMFGATLECSIDGANVWMQGGRLDPVLVNELNETGILDYDEHSLANTRFGCRTAVKSAMPRWDRGLQLDESPRSAGESLILGNVAAAAAAAGFLLMQTLQRFRYVGPIREAPPRNYLPPRRTDESRWARGLAAWDALVASEALRQEVSSWLGPDERMDTGYRIEWRRFREVDDDTFYGMQIAANNSELDESFIWRTHGLPQTGRLVVVDEAKDLALAPCALGEGISQVVPIIAAAIERTVVTPDGLEEEVGLVAMEQPELHIHPRMQVVLGDLLLARCDDRQFLVETHSEHLMLRLLRRIRETTDRELPSGAPSATVQSVGVFYVEQRDGEVRATRLRVSDDGEFEDRWPSGFFAERLRELL